MHRLVRHDLPVCGEATGDGQTGRRLLSRSRRRRAARGRGRYALAEPADHRQDRMRHPALHDGRLPSTVNRHRLEASTGQLRGATVRPTDGCCGSKRRSARPTPPIDRRQPCDRRDEWSRPLNSRRLSGASSTQSTPRLPDLSQPAIRGARRAPHRLGPGRVVDQLPRGDRSLRSATARIRHGRRALRNR